MKPPVLGQRPPVDPLPGLWATGAVFGLAGLGVMLFDNPLVPLSHEFQLIPLGLGGAVGAALLRERFGPRALAAYVVVMAWLVWQVLSVQTTGGIVLLAAGLFSLTRALVKTVGDG